MSDDPMDHYNAYNNWLMQHYRPANGDELIKLFEAEEGFEEFLAQRHEDI